MIGMILLKALIVVFSTAMAALTALVTTIVVQGLRTALIPRRRR